MKFAFLLLVSLCCACGSEESNIPEKTKIVLEDVKMVYLKQQLHGSDSLILNREQINHVVELWNTANSEEMRKSIPNYWLYILQKEGETRTLRITGKYIKEHGDWNYILKEEGYFESLWPLQTPNSNPL